MDVTMPQLGETVTEGTITRWLKQVGEHVEADEPLFEVSTDKVDSEVPAPVGRVVTEILVPEGETVEVGTRLAVLGDADAAAAAPAAARPPPRRRRPQPEPAPAAAPAPAAGAGAGTGARARAPAPEPAPRRPSPVAPAAEPAAAEPEPAPPRARAGARPEPAEPPTRRRRRRAHVADRAPARRRARPRPVARSQGTGPGGRITRKDVLDAAAAARRAAAPAAPPLPTPGRRPPRPRPSRRPRPPARRRAAARAAPAPAGARAGPGRRGAGRRRRGGARRGRPVRQHPPAHGRAHGAVEGDERARVHVGRGRLRARRARPRRAPGASGRRSEGFSLTYLPFIARAFCDTVDDFPHVNASVDDDTLVVHRDVHLVDRRRPRLRGARRAGDPRRRRQAPAAHRARDPRPRRRAPAAEQLMPDDVLGGTFTITNPGPFGTFMTLPIINQPQVAILSTDGIKKRPVVVDGPDGDDVIAIHHTGMLVLTWDHRAFDGAYAAAFLGAIQDVLEQRDWEAELD